MKHPWENEENKYVFSYMGFPCSVLRNKVKALCGYVGLGIDHPYYRKSYDELHDKLEVHGGLTYSGELGNKSNFWWIGFDCAHAYDLSPGMYVDFNEELRKIPGGDFKFHNDSQETYRTIAYVKKEIRNLVKQLKKVNE